jgi:microcin C transport system substrate-binding protein
VRVKVIRDLNIAYQHFVKGELDTFGLIMPRFWHKKAQGRPYDNGYIGKLKFYNEVPQPAHGIYLNEDDPLFQDRRVRYAFAHAMHIDKVLSTVLRGDYERLQTMNEGYGDYSNRAIRARDFDLHRADELLREAGWGERGADGIRSRNGERLSVRITYVTAEHTPRLVVLKEEARKAGIELNLQLLDPFAGFKQILEKKHQAAWMAWSGGGLSPRYWQFFHSSNAHVAQTNNITNTDAPEMDRLITAYRAARDKDERVRLAHALEQKVFDIGSVIPTYKVPYTREAFWRWIKLPPALGTRTSDSLFAPFGTPGGLFWIDETMRERVTQARRRNRQLPPIYREDTQWRAL